MAVERIIIVKPGEGCGEGSDGAPCTPAYLCPACIRLLIQSQNGGK